MVDELWDLVIGESGLLVYLRHENELNENLYKRIIEILSVLTDEWESKDCIPKKALLIISELVEALAGGSRFLNDVEALKVEDASIEVRSILNKLYSK